MAGGRDDRSSSASTRDALALLRLPPPLAVGLILVGCCPGGTVSNVVTLIARADVALSVMMATLSTLAAVLLIPPLTGLLAGRYVPVDGWKLLLDVLLAALLLHGGGFFLGWLIPAQLGQPSR